MSVVPNECISPTDDDNFEKYRLSISCPGCHATGTLNKDGKEPSIRYRCKIKECRKTTSKKWIQLKIDQLSNVQSIDWADDVDGLLMDSESISSTATPSLTPPSWINPISSAKSALFHPNHLQSSPAFAFTSPAAIVTNADNSLILSSNPGHSSIEKGNKSLYGTIMLAATHD